MLAVGLGSLIVLGIKSWGQALGVELRSRVPTGLGYQAVLSVKLESWILSLVVKPWMSNLGIGYRPLSLLPAHSRLSKDN